MESRFTGVRRELSSPSCHVIKKLLRNFEVSRGHFFKKLRGLNAEVVSYKKKACMHKRNRDGNENNSSNDSNVMCCNERRKYLIDAMNYTNLSDS